MFKKKDPIEIWNEALYKAKKDKENERRELIVIIIVACLFLIAIALKYLG